MKLKQILLSTVILLVLMLAVLDLQVVESRPAAQEGTPTPQASSTPATPTPSPQAEIEPFVDETGPLLVFLDVPSTAVSSPYVVISAFPEAEGLVIRGSVFGRDFVCRTSPCRVPFTGVGLLTFQAFDANGRTSAKVEANIDTTLEADGYKVRLVNSNQPRYEYRDACGDLWRNLPPVPPDWAVLPQNPARLNTDKPLYYLASQLVNAGIVDVSGCPSGGFSFGSLNACGMERSRPAVRQWQNLFDYTFWRTAIDQQVPPKLLKTLIEIESQFWPDNQRFYLDEFGLGQVNEQGIDVILRTNPTLYQEVCRATLRTCDRPYVGLPESQRALLRGVVLQSLDASCPTCAYGFDLKKANQSIPMVATTLRANCSETQSILRLYNLSAGYEDSWKITMATYHAGMGCLLSAASQFQPGTVVSWSDLSGRVACRTAADYVDRVWSSLTGFDKYTYRPADDGLQVAEVVPPQPTATPYVSTATLVVRTYLDLNGDGVAQSVEWLNGVQVEVRFENGTILTGVTANGEVSFNLSGYLVNSAATVTLPLLFRSETLRIPPTGTVPVTFKFDTPVIPTQVP